MNHPPPEVTSQEAFLSKRDHEMVDTAIDDYKARIAPDPIARLDWTDDMRHGLARRLVAEIEWRTPHATPDSYHRSFSQDLDTITEIAWFTELGHDQVRVLRDEHLAASGGLEREERTRSESFRQMNRRVHRSLVLYYRPCRRAHRVRRGRPARMRERRPGTRRRLSSSSTTSSADPPDSDGDHEPPLLWRHDRWGLCTPALLRLLLSVEVER